MTTSPASYRPRDVLAASYGIALAEDEAARLDAAVARLVALLGPRLVGDDPPPAGFAGSAQTEMSADA